MNQLGARLFTRTLRSSCLRPMGICAIPRRPYSSDSSITPRVPYDWFNKTGEKASDDPTEIRMSRDEYSKSGGDDIVSETLASFKAVHATDPAFEKIIAGRGLKINPLDISPADPELSRTLTEEYVERNIERAPGVKSGLGPTRKSKRIEKTTIDFRSN